MSQKLVTKTMKSRHSTLKRLYKSIWQGFDKERKKEIYFLLKTRHMKIVKFTA